MYQRILVPVDGSPTSDKGLGEAIAVAKLTGGSIRLLHVVDELVFTTGFETGATYENTVLPGLRERSARILDGARGRVEAAGIAVETLTIECFARRPSEIIVEQAATWPADVIVIGTHGRRGVSRVMLGSDAEQVVRMAPVPVLLVRSDENAASSAAGVAREPAAASSGAATA